MYYDAHRSSSEEGPVRRDDQQNAHLFSYLSPEERVPADHPLRAVRRMTDAALDQLSPRFALMYSKTGRPSVPPEQLLRALLPQILYSVRSERMLMEQLEYNLLFRWFVGVAMDDRVWTPTTFTRNRERLVGRRRRPGVLSGSGDRNGRGPADVRRSFHNGWDAARGV